MAAHGFDAVAVMRIELSWGIHRKLPTLAPPQLIEGLRMKVLKIVVLGMVLGCGLAAPSFAQTVGYNIRTGDVWVDTRLVEINDYGRHYRDPFIGEMTGYYGAPRSLVVELLDERRWSPADVYFACSIAHVLGIPCLNVVREYDRNPGQGWGNLAKRMGIKPGSAAFHDLKRGTASTYDRWGYPVRVDQQVRVDWSKHGPGKGQGGSKGKSSSAQSAGGKSSQGAKSSQSGKPSQQGKPSQGGKSEKGGKDDHSGHGQGQKDKGGGKGNGRDK